MFSTRLSCAAWLRIGLLVAVLMSRAARGADPAREAGHPFLQNYSPQQYQAHGQVWSAVQDAKGVMYFGNRHCVLAYDGVTWRKIPVPTTSDVFGDIYGLAIEPETGTIFVSSDGQLGYLKDLLGGDKEFVSLLDKLPPDARDMKSVRCLCATSGGMVFAAGHQVMRWHDGQFKIWNFPKRGRLISTCAGGQLYVHQGNFEMRRLEGDEFVPVPTPPALVDAQMMAMVPSPDGSVLLCTLRHGLWVLRDHVFTPLTGESNEFFKTKEIRQCIRLHDGSLAVATGYAGLVLLDKDGRFVSRYDEKTGIQHQTILNLFEDREAGVWLCLNSGLTRMELGSSLSVFDPGNGLDRVTVRDILRVDGTLYMASSSGVYRLVEANPATAAAAYCERLPNTDGFFISLCAVDGGFLAGNLQGIAFFDSRGQMTQIYDGVRPDCLWRSRTSPARVFFGTGKGLRSVRRDTTSGRWIEEGIVPGSDAEVYTIAGNVRGEVWIGTGQSGIMRLTFAPDGPAGERGAAIVTRFLQQPGLLGDQPLAHAMPWNRDEVFVLTQRGLYRFDDHDQSFHEVADYDHHLWRPEFRLGNIVRDADGDLWVSGHAPNDVWKDRLFGRAGAGTVFQSLPAKIAANTDEFETFYVEGDDAKGKVLWLSGAASVVRVDTQIWVNSNVAPPFATLVRRATVTGEDEQDQTPQTILREPLPYRRNTARFDFAANTYGYGANVQYQTRLRGLGDGNWTGFDHRATVDYTNLPEGEYMFEARARNADGNLGTIGHVPFRILAPWQRTPWAYTTYGLLAAASVFGIVRWQSRRLHRLNVRLETLVAARTDELHVHEGELVRAKESADTANRAKSAFLANMSHELRTPLNAILGYAQIMLKDRELSARNRERLTVVAQSGGHLLAMINEVLDLSKIEAGKVSLHRTDFFLGQLLDEVCAVFRPRLAEKGLGFRCERPPVLPCLVHGDSDKLRQVLFNLLGNAFKFTQQGGVDFVVSSADADRVRFDVKDTGIGIAEEELREVFVAFHQASGHRMAAQGTGLGLAISQRFVELLGGRLEVESVLGQGSRFWFEITLPPVVAEGARSVLEDARGGQRPVTGFQGPPRRVLIVDDDAVVRQVLCELLEPLGFEVEQATGGEECLRRCAQHVPDVVLLDLRMEGMDGFSVARALRLGGSPGAGVKIIAVSASVFESDRQQAVAAGCDDFLPKPFQEKQLLAALERLLGVTWIYGLPPETREKGADGLATEDTPPAEEIDAMLELSRRGDILGIKKRLGALQAAGGGGCSSFVRGLEPLVAGYQMDRIRDVLIKCKENENAGA